MALDVGQKKQMAKGLRGVSYDARIDRFTAEIYEGGGRRWLGSYHTAQQAADAYAEAAAQRTPRERSQSAFAQVYASFRDRHGGSDTDPPVGALLEYKEQHFEFTGLTWRRVRGRMFAFAVWRSACRTCGAEYTTMTPMPVSVAKGITRNCHEHVTKDNPFGQKNSKPGAKNSPPLSVGERIAAQLTALGAVYDRLPLQRVAELVADRVPGLDAGVCVRMIRGWGVIGGKKASDTPLPVTLSGDDVLFSDHPARGLL